jgi:hypothetical protein
MPLSSVARSFFQRVTLCMRIANVLSISAKALETNSTPRSVLSSSGFREYVGVRCAFECDVGDEIRRPSPVELIGYYFSFIGLPWSRHLPLGVIMC